LADRKVGEMSPSEAYTMMKLAAKCRRAGHDLVRGGNPDVQTGFVLVCRTCKVAYDIPSADTLFAELSKEEVKDLMEDRRRP